MQINALKGQAQTTILFLFLLFQYPSMPVWPSTPGYKEQHCGGYTAGQSSCTGQWLTSLAIANTLTKATVKLHPHEWINKSLSCIFSTRSICKSTFTKSTFITTIKLQRLLSVWVVYIQFGIHAHKTYDNMTFQISFSFSIHLMSYKNCSSTIFNWADIHSVRHSFDTQHLLCIKHYVFKLANLVLFFDSSRLEPQET